MLLSLFPGRASVWDFPGASIHHDSLWSTERQLGKWPQQQQSPAIGYSSKCKIKSYEQLFSCSCGSFFFVVILSLSGKQGAMLGAAAAGLLRGCPGMNRVGAMVVGVGARSLPAALGRPGHGAPLSSMTASRSGA